jgi:hypothetical protein
VLLLRRALRLALDIQPIQHHLRRGPQMLILTSGVSNFKAADQTPPFQPASEIHACFRHSAPSRYLVSALQI